MQSERSDDTLTLTLDKDEMYTLHELLQAYKADERILLNGDERSVIDEFADHYFGSPL